MVNKSWKTGSQFLPMWTIQEAPHTAGAQTAHTGYKKSLPKRRASSHHFPLFSVKSPPPVSVDTISPSLTREAVFVLGFDFPQIKYHLNSARFFTWSFILSRFRPTWRWSSAAENAQKRLVVFDQAVICIDSWSPKVPDTIYIFRSVEKQNRWV